MNDLQIQQIISKVSGLEVHALKPELSLDEIGWDSLSNLAFISEVDEVMNLRIDADRLSSSKTVGDLILLLQG